MPFAVFRKHQRKLLAIFAILAMFGFVLSDSLPALTGRGRDGRGGVNDPIIAKLKWKTIRSSDLAPIREQRQRANAFISALRSFPQPIQVFGGTSVPELLDALIFEHEAIELGMPATPDIANRWLQQVVTGGAVNTRFIEDTFRRSPLADQVTDEQLLYEIANQIRIREVQVLPATADATPYDVFSAFRAKEEKVSAYAVAVKVEDFLGAVPEPTAEEIQTLFDQAKDKIADPRGSEPGFKIPQKAKFEMVVADLDAMAAAIQAKLTAAELRETYTARKAEFPGNVGELPHNLFAGAPDLTPHDSFPDVRDLVARKLANERATEEIEAKFEDIKTNVMGPFREKYYELDPTGGEKPDEKAQSLKPADLLKNAAGKAGLTYEATPLVPANRPDMFGAISKSHLGSTASFDAMPFDSLAFSSRVGLYSPLDLSDSKFLDDSGHRFLAWKIADEPSRVPTLDEVKADVVKAWKLAKARPLAEAEAKKLLAAVERDGGGAKIRGVAGKRPVVTTEARPKIVPAPFTGQSTFGETRLVEIVEIPNAGDEIRDAIFTLTEKTAVVAPDSTKTNYYVLSLRSREEAEFDQLYSFGQATTVYRDVANDAGRELFQEWRQFLREKAGLPADWAPPASDAQ